MLSCNAFTFGVLCVLISFLMLECNARPHYIQVPPNDLKVNDLIEWTGRTNRLRRRTFLIIRGFLQSGPTKTKYSFLKLEMRAAAYKILISNGVYGKEGKAKVCYLGKSLLGLNKQFRILIRVLPTSFKIYMNGELKIQAWAEQNIQNVTTIAVYNSLSTRVFRLLTTKDISEKLQGNRCGGHTLRIPPPKAVCNTTDYMRVIGGTDAHPGANPWQASIRKVRQPAYETNPHTCGATIIDKCWAISAAHCFPSTLRSFLNKTVVRVGDYYNKDGTPFSNDPRFERSQDIHIEQVYIHDSYKYSPVPTNDVALIKLKQCLTFNTFVQPACLPVSPDQFPGGTTCGVSGWGAVVFDQPQDNYPPCLQQAGVLVHPDDRCQRQLRRKYQRESMICAGNSKTDTCSGDSGGPLVCLNKNGGYTVWGITSWGIECGIAGKPGVYTRVSSFMNWIYIKMRLSPQDEELPEHHFCQNRQ